MIRSHHLSAILTAATDLHHLTPAELLAWMQTAVKIAELTAVGELTATFHPQGISAVLILEESHVALHVWSETGKVCVDIHVCDYFQDNLCKAEKLAEQLTKRITGTSDRTQWRYLLAEG
jgi:S-adenosylmethionine decarboxylase